MERNYQEAVGRTHQRSSLKEWRLLKKAPRLHFWIKVSLWFKIYQQRITSSSQGFHTCTICFIMKAQTRGCSCSRTKFSAHHLIDQSVLQLRYFHRCLPGVRAAVELCLCWSKGLCEGACGPPSIQCCPPVCSGSDIWPETGRPWARGGWPSGPSAGPQGRRRDSPAHWQEGRWSLRGQGQVLKSLYTADVQHVRQGYRMQEAWMTSGEIKPNILCYMTTLEAEKHHVSSVFMVRLISAEPANCHLSQIHVFIYSNVF